MADLIQAESGPGQARADEDKVADSPDSPNSPPAADSGNGPQSVDPAPRAGSYATAYANAYAALSPAEISAALEAAAAGVFAEAAGTEPAAAKAADAAVAALEAASAESSDDTSQLTKHDMLQFVRGAVQLVAHNIDDYDRLVNVGVSKIMTDLFNIERTVPNTRQQTEADRRRQRFVIRIRFHDVKVYSPTHLKYSSGQAEDLLPAAARREGHAYAGPLTLGATVAISAIYDDGRVEEKGAAIPPFEIGTFPIMVGSSVCHTRYQTREALKQLGEDPNDHGGYFVVNRGEYIIDLLENICYNKPHYHLAMKPNELVRMEFLSQPGGPFENSSQLRVRYMANGQLTVETTSIKFKKARFPFYLLYRMFGMTSDRDIVETIVFDLEDRSPTAQAMLAALERAFQPAAGDSFAPLAREINREAVVQQVAQQLVTLTRTELLNKDNPQHLNRLMLGGDGVPGALDRMVLPHLGQSPADRANKLRYLGQLIHKLFLVHLRLLRPTDRDNLTNKRVHGAGISLAKAFKTQVNLAVVSELHGSLKRALEDTAWENITEKLIVDTVRGAFRLGDLGAALESSITAGSKATVTIGSKQVRNRMSCQTLERKNGLNVVSETRTVVTPNTGGKAAKQTERADRMRRVHPTYVGYICVTQSADTGENVGMRKQLAVTATVCGAGDAALLTAALLAADVTPLAAVASADLLRRDLARVFVNGEWIGCAPSAAALVEKYRGLRRAGRIDPHTTVCWDPQSNEAVFWLDVGRLRRPLLIVENNLAEYDAARRARRPIPFRQQLRYTRAHAAALAAGALTVDDLVRAQVAEYITPEEAENCCVAPSIAELAAAAGDVLRRYTHCEVEQALFGLAALLAPYANHTQPARNTYETNQGRQTGGWYALNWAHRDNDKNRFLQYRNEMPLTRTLTQSFVSPNGVNAIVAYTSYGGDNQEDSAIVSQASADRGLFQGAFYYSETVELEKNERFGNPDALTTRNMKPNACYEKLVDGFVRAGTTVRFGDVLVGRVAKNLRRGPEAAGFEWADRSVVYRRREPAVVESVKEVRGADDEKQVIVKLRFERALRIGDKLSSREGNKSIVARMYPQSDMPYTADGMVPDLIINTHSFPTRMTIGQLIETSVGKACARRGVVVDATAFLPVDHDAIARELVEGGFRYNGLERMHNGLTGEHFDAAIFIGPTVEQRLQKFVLDDEQSVAGSGPTDATTGQPLGGKNLQGGLRLGEMEVWCLCSHGAMLNIYEKLSVDSDGRPMYVCRRCRNPAICNPRKDIYRCRVCNEMADIAVVDGSKTGILFQEELATAGARMMLGLAPREFPA